MSADVSEVIQKLELPPLRTLDDFALGSARFQLPNLKDFDKWGNRVVKNLIYYQTNYFLMFITIYGIMVIFNPFKIVCGLLVQAMMMAVLLQFFQKKNRILASHSAADNQKWYMLAGALLVGYLFLHFFDALLLSGFTLLLPFSLTFVHASLRLRNLKNKVANTMVNLSASTPMAVFLDTFNIAADSLLN
uniref:PRA1 family protein n=1 Tax=Glossina morsitans morsitans TaxID=37546 RepID=A0A1B0FGC6_GLOMM